MSSEDAIMRNRGFEPCPDVQFRCERFFGAGFTFALVGLCLTVTTVRAWIPAVIFSYEQGLTDGVRWLLFVGALIGLVTGAMSLISLARVCMAHPGRIWYRVIEGQPPAQDEVPVQPRQSTPGVPQQMPTMPSNGSLFPADTLQPPTVRASQPQLTESSVDAERLRHISGGYYGTGAMRHCATCDRPKPPTVHHCKRCGTCVDRMDHHCPWIGQCVGRGNHKFFALFLFYTAVCGLVITATTMPNFIRFFSDMMDSDSSSPSPPDNITPPPPTSSSAAPVIPTATSHLSPSHAHKFSDVDLLLVFVWFVATMFGLVLTCFFGNVWDSAVEGSTQLDAARPYDPMRSVADNESANERARASREYLKRWSMGRGSAALWFVPITPVFDEDSIARAG